MICFKVAGDEHFDELLEIIYHQEAQHLKPILDLIQLTSDQFGQLFHSTGVVYRILVDGCLAGLCWIEICGRILQLHSLILKYSFQEQGIGTQTLKWLEEYFRWEIDEIQLIVHYSNPRAKALYERCGYRTTCNPDPCGFYTMRKKL
jgi:ribosomal protein S18 acetylase RimI-like enzyme